MYDELPKFSGKLSVILTINGYALARTYWGQGFASEVVRMLVNWMLAQPNIYRIWAVCDLENRASDRVLEKSGLICEGVLRRWLIHPNISNEPRDCACYATVN
jgi:ribosomal-protein-alanine N-acetyltransferase